MRQFLRITAVAGYHGKSYRDEKSLPREALVFNTSHRVLLFKDNKDEHE